MEPPNPWTVAPPYPPPPAQPAWGWTPPPPQPERPKRVPKRYLKLRSGVDRRVLLGAVVAGLVFDLAARSGFVTISGMLLVLTVAVALLLSRRIEGLASRLLIAAAPILGVMLVLRSSPWVIAPTVLSIALLLMLGVSLGADGAGLRSTFPAFGNRIALVTGHLVFASGLFRPSIEGSPDGVARRRAIASARGALLAVPVMVVIGLLLESADPVFRSWFDLPALLGHIILLLCGAWVYVGLTRAASAVEPLTPMPSAPSLGTVEAAWVLGGLCILYAAFVVAQFVALLGGGHHVLVTHDLTYAQYARSGFFQLLACAGITLLVLLGVRACTEPARRILMVLCGTTVVLTLAVVVVAIRRLQLYEAAFGLTLLRLACLVAAAWIGVVFVLLGVSLPERGLRRRWLPAAVVLSGVLFVGLWGFSNPASVVAQTNLSRAEQGRPFDVTQAAGLGPDALPTLAAGLGHLGAVQEDRLRRAICGRSTTSAAGAAFNQSIAAADRATTGTCSRPR